MQTKNRIGQGTRQKFRKDTLVCHNLFNKTRTVQAKDSSQQQLFPGGTSIEQVAQLNIVISTL